MSYLNNYEISFKADLALATGSPVGQEPTPWTVLANHIIDLKKEIDNLSKQLNENNNLELS